MEYLEDKQLIIWRPVGLLDVAAIMEYYQNLKTCNWGHRANRFCDFSAIEKFALDYNGLSAIRDYRLAYLSDHVGMKLAMYSSTTLGYAMSRMYQALMEGYGLDIWVTKDIKLDF